MRWRGRLYAAASLRCDARGRAGIHASCFCHCYYWRPRFNAGCIDWRRTYWSHGGDGRAPVFAIRQKHVRLRLPCISAALPPTGYHGQEGGMIGGFFDDVPYRGLLLLGVLLAFMLIAPLFAGDYLLTILIVVLYFAYTGLAWNIMMGFVGQLSLGHALYVGLGAYTAAPLYVHFDICPWIGLLAAVSVAMLAGAFIVYLAFRFRICGRYFVVFSVAGAEFARC